MDKTWPDFRFDDSSGGASRWLANLAAGTIASLLIFLALSRVRVPRIEKPPPSVETLQLARVPDLPPPPPREETAAPAVVGSALPFPVALKGSSLLEPSPSDSIVRVRATSPSMGPTVRPAIEPALNFDPGLFRPRAELAETDPNHVFNVAEVDQPATPRFQPSPNISRRLFESVKDPRIALLMLITAEGKVENVWLLRTSGNEEFDARMIEGVKEWEFHPARKHGKAVRQWAQQPFVIRLPSTSRFSN